MVLEDLIWSMTHVPLSTTCSSSEMFFFRFGSSGLHCWGTFARTRPYVKRPAADWWHWWGRGNPPSKTWALEKLKHILPLSSFIYMITCVYIDFYIYIQYTQRYIYIHRIQGEMVILLEMSLKTTSEAKQPWRRWSETWRPSNISPATWDTTAPGPGVTVFTGMKGRARHGCFQKIGVPQNG